MADDRVTSKVIGSHSTKPDEVKIASAMRAMMTAVGNIALKYRLTDGETIALLGALTSMVADRTDLRDQTALLFDKWAERLRSGEMVYETAQGECLMLKVQMKSMLTGESATMELDVTLEQLHRVQMRRQNHELIQNIVPHLTAEQREFLMTGVTPAEWAKAFPKRCDNCEWSMPGATETVVHCGCAGSPHLNQIVQADFSCDHYEG